MAVPGRRLASSTPQVVGVTLQLSVPASGVGGDRGSACVGGIREGMEALESQIKSEELNNPSSYHSATQKAQLLVLELPNLALHSGMVVLQEWDGSMLG